MSTAAIRRPANSALPACLFENPNKLVSLLDMLRFYAQRFIGASCTFGQAMMEIRVNRAQGYGRPSPNTLSAVAGNFGMLQRLCEEMNLRFSASHILRIKNEPDLLEPENLLKAMEEVQQRIWDELDARLYLQINPDTSSYFQPDQPPFGQKVFDSFATAIGDVMEASNCIALERPTAAVFHLMRVMEAALKALALDLGIPYAPSWESYLRQLTTLVDGDWKTKSQEIRGKQTFYKQVIGDLQAVKIAWRNPTMHIVKLYSDPEALKIYECVKQLMVNLVEEGLSEREPAISVP